MNYFDRIIRVPYVWEALRKAGLLKGRQQRDYRRLLKAQREIDERLRHKKEAHEKINVLFVCHRPALWVNLKDVYETLKADPLFDVKILAVPQRNKIKGRSYFHEHFDGEGAEEFWAGENCIPGYNYETGKWVDVESLAPDYVFFQQPYNIARPNCLLSSNVSRYAKIVYLTYYVQMELLDRAEQCTPVDFMRDLSFYFAQNEEDRKFVEGRLYRGGPNICRIKVTGHPRLEKMGEKPAEECTLWHDPDSFKILWTPRWTTREGNCHFFNYREPLINWCKSHKNVELMFRPHPQAFKEYISNGDMTEEQEKQIREEFSRGAFQLDEGKDFYPQMFSSDVLVSDSSSLMIDYYFTGHPIVYCASNGVHDTFTEKLSPGLYWLNTWEEVEKTLDDLYNGKDELKECREKCARDLQDSEGKGAIQKIYETIREDALK